MLFCSVSLCLSLERLHYQTETQVQPKQQMSLTLHHMMWRTFFLVLAFPQLTRQISKVVAQYGIITLKLSSPFTAATKIDLTYNSERKINLKY